MPLLGGDPVREEQRVRALLPPTPMPALDEAASTLRLPPLVHDEVERRRRARAGSSSTAQYLEDGPSSVVDIHLYEETARFHALLNEATSPWLRAAWAVRNASSLARAPPTYREAARALHAAAVQN